MPQLILALVSLSKTRFQVAAGIVEPGGRVEWKLCTEIALADILSDDPLVGMDQSLLDLLIGAAQILVHQRQVLALLRRIKHVREEAVQFVDPPLPFKRGCTLWPLVVSPPWKSLLAKHWKAVDLIYTHVRRIHQAEVAEQLRQNPMKARDLFQQFAYRSPPRRIPRDALRESEVDQASNDRVLVQHNKESRAV